MCILEQEGNYGVRSPATCAPFRSFNRATESVVQTTRQEGRLRTTFVESILSENWRASNQRLYNCDDVSISHDHTPAPRWLP